MPTTTKTNTLHNSLVSQILTRSRLKHLSSMLLSWIPNFCQNSVRSLCLYYNICFSSVAILSHPAIIVVRLFEALSPNDVNNVCFSGKN